VWCRVGAELAQPHDCDRTALPDRAHGYGAGALVTEDDDGVHDRPGCRGLAGEPPGRAGS